MRVLFYFFLVGLSISCFGLVVCGILWQHYVTQLLRKTDKMGDGLSSLFARLNIGMLIVIKLAKEVDYTLHQKLRHVFVTSICFFIGFAAFGMLVLLLAEQVFGG